MGKIKENVFVPISYEYMMSHLFGKQNYHGHVGELSKSTWKKDLRKINKYIKKSITINLDADEYHKGMLLYLCDCLDEKIAKAKSLNEINVSFVETYTRLIFSFLGDFPDHWNKKSPYAKQFWELDGHRSVCYTQTDEQKAALIINLVDNKQAFKVEMDEFENMHRAYLSFNSDPKKFIQWVKDRHPRLYCEIF